MIPDNENLIYPFPQLEGRTKESALSLDFAHYALFAVMTETTRTSCREVQADLTNSYSLRMPSQHFLKTMRLVNCCRKGLWRSCEDGLKSQFDPGVLPHMSTNQIPFLGVNIVGNDIGQVIFLCQSVSTSGQTWSYPYDSGACPDDNVNLRFPYSSGKIQGKVRKRQIAHIHHI